MNLSDFNFKSTPPHLLFLALAICLTVLSTSCSDSTTSPTNSPAPVSKTSTTPSPKPTHLSDSYLTPQKTCPYKAEPISKEFYRDQPDGTRIYTCCKECLVQVDSNTMVTKQLIRARGERLLTKEEAEDPMKRWEK